MRIGEQLGRGGFGAVYRGRHLGLDVDVAVKVLDADAGDPTGVERALSEARLMARLDHPNVLRIHDAGCAGSAIYLVLEIMDGGNSPGCGAWPRNAGSTCAAAPRRAPGARRGEGYSIATSSRPTACSARGMSE